jgi:hypothetical protein
MAEINSIGKVVQEGNENHDVRGTYFSLPSAQLGF